jgi:peptidoglycan/LPS O-acetylase OafA/YrhL
MVVLHHTTFVHFGLQADTAPEKWSNLTTGLLASTRWMNMGVPLFFVISGYCISAAADRARRSPYSVRSYFARRFRRIYPPLWIAIMVSALSFALTDYLLFPGLLSSAPWSQFPPTWFSGWKWIGNLTLTESWRFHLVGDGRGYYLQQTWSLCYEEQFYVVTGLLLLVAPHKYFRASAVLTGILTLVACACRMLSINVSGFFFDGSWCMFAAGILVYYSINYATARQRSAGIALLVAGVAWAFSVAWIHSGSAFAFALLLLALHRWDAWLCSAKFLRPLKYCGTMCYSLYLVHQLPIKALSYGLYRLGIQTDVLTLLVTVPSCLTLSVFLGWGFYRAVERRFLNSPHANSEARAQHPHRAERSAGGSRQRKLNEVLAATNERFAVGSLVVSNQ